MMEEEIIHCPCYVDEDSYHCWANEYVGCYSNFYAIEDIQMDIYDKITLARMVRGLSKPFRVLIYFIEEEFGD